MSVGALCVRPNGVFGRVGPHALAEHCGAFPIVFGLGHGAASEMDAPAARGFPRGGRNFRMTGVRHSHPDRADGPARLDPNSSTARMGRLYKIAHIRKKRSRASSAPSLFARLEMSVRRGTITPRRRWVAGPSTDPKSTIRCGGAGRPADSHVIERKRRCLCQAKVC
jgi:hypothetical protein